MALSLGAVCVSKALTPACGSPALRSTPAGAPGQRHLAQASQDLIVVRRRRRLLTQPLTCRAANSSEVEKSQAEDGRSSESSVSVQEDSGDRRAERGSSPVNGRPQDSSSGSKGSNGRSWQPSSPSQPKDNLNGWGSPIELDKSKFEVSFNAGLPEIAAGLAFALGIGVFAFAAFHKSGVKYVSLEPVPSAKLLQQQAEGPSAGKAESLAEADKAGKAETEQLVQESSDNGDRAGAAQTDRRVDASASVQAGEAEDKDCRGGTDSKELQNESDAWRDSLSHSEAEEHAAGPEAGSRHEGFDGNDADGEDGGEEVDTQGQLSFSALMQPFSDTVEPEEEDELENTSEADSVEAAGKEQPAGVTAFAQAPGQDIHTATPPGEGLPQGYMAASPAPMSAVNSSSAKGATAGRVVVPAVVDQAQIHALEALQALKVVEDDVDPAGICTRREYARWVLSASSTLSRKVGERVFPAMYVEDMTELAFDDVLPSDADFAAIQGLAEAGLISSKLSWTDLACDRFGGKRGCSAGEQAMFQPDSPLTRQDLICWKVALENRNLPAVDAAFVKKLSGYMDVDRIDKDALPAIALDLAAGDKSIITSAFGFTRRFEPGKPVTHGQAAVTLALGESAEIVGEELARLEAEAEAEAAVAVAEAEEAAELKAKEDEAAAATEELQREKNMREEAERRAEEVRRQLASAQAQRDEEKETIVRTQAAIETERYLLAKAKHAAEEQIEVLSSRKQKVENEKERLEGLRSRAQAEREAAVQLKAELEAEKKALAIARSWAEEEVQKARDESRRLEAFRRALESREEAAASVLEKLPVEEIVPVPKWPATRLQAEKEKAPEMPDLGSFFKKFKLEDVPKPGSEEGASGAAESKPSGGGGGILSSLKLDGLLEDAGVSQESVRDMQDDVRGKAEALKNDGAVNKAEAAVQQGGYAAKASAHAVQDAVGRAGDVVGNALGDAGDRLQEATRDARGASERAASAATGNVRKFVEELKEGAGKLAGQFKAKPT